jgi:hypothetical protein
MTSEGGTVCPPQIRARRQQLQGLLKPTIVMHFVVDFGLQLTPCPSIHNHFLPPPSSDIRTDHRTQLETQLATTIGT